MTKIEELVRLLENRGRLGTDQYARLLALKALEALPELREAAAAADAYREDDTFDEGKRMAELLRELGFVTERK